jgi:hypothetical protein
LDLLDALIAHHHALFATDSTLARAHRPQRHDLTIAKPPV